MTTSARRFRLFVGVLGLCFLALEIRLFHIQVVMHPELRATADRLHRSTEAVLAARGYIVDRDGHVLAQSVAALDLYADSRHTLDDRDAIARCLETILHPAADGRAFADARDENGSELRALLDRDGYRKLLPRPIWNGDQVAQLRQAKRDGLLSGVVLDGTWTRRYAEGASAAGLIGYVDSEGRGAAGLELTYDAYLRGTDGSRETRRDNARAPLFDADCQMVPPSPGADVRLTLDVVIQHSAEAALDEAVAQFRPTWAVAVVLDPRNGEVLALANRPTFDPNHYSNYPLDQHQNRTIASQYTPGSAFKPYVMAAAIEAGVVSLSERIDCDNGVHNFDGRLVHDAHPHGLLTPLEIIAESSNIGMSKIMMRMVPADASGGGPSDAQLASFRRLHRLFTDLGFGQKSGIGVAGEESGLVRPVSQWTRKYTAVSMAFGHELAVTPLQMAAAFAVFATDGVYHTPVLLDSVVGGDGRVLVEGHRAERQVFDPKTARRMRAMLEAVVLEGTGKRAMLDGYRVAGKTSTAEYETDASRHTASFVGFAPVEDPRVLVLIVLDQPQGEHGEHMGGDVAAPAAARILSDSLTYLRVAPHRSADSDAASVARTPR